MEELMPTLINEVIAISDRLSVIQGFVALQVGFLFAFSFFAFTFMRRQ